MWARSATLQVIPSPAKLGIKRPAGMFRVQEPEPHPWTVQAGISWSASSCVTVSTRSENAAYLIPFSRAQSPSQWQGGSLPDPEIFRKSRFPEKPDKGWLGIKEVWGNEESRSTSNNTWELPFVGGNCAHISKTFPQLLLLLDIRMNIYIHTNAHMLDYIILLSSNWPENSPLSSQVQKWPSNSSLNDITTSLGWVCSSTLTSSRIAMIHCNQKYSHWPWLKARQHGFVLNNTGCSSFALLLCHEPPVPRCSHLSAIFPTTCLTY